MTVRGIDILSREELEEMLAEERALYNSIMELLQGEFVKGSGFAGLLKERRSLQDRMLEIRAALGESKRVDAGFAKLKRENERLKSELASLKAKMGVDFS